jgi:hypothetical protein
MSPEKYIELVLTALGQMKRDDKTGEWTMSSDVRNKLIATGWWKLDNKKETP